MTVYADSGLAPAGMWPEIDPCLLEGTRAPAAPFPLDVLPGRWRGWVEDCSRAGIPADYVAQCSLAVAAALTGGRMRAEITDEWYEPLVLWQALVGEPASGKSPALLRAQSTMRNLQSVEGAENPTPVILADATTFLANAAFRTNSHGVVLWREDLADWIAAANAPRERSGWLAGWEAGQLAAGLASQTMSFSLGILGTVRPDRLGALFGPDDNGALATRFLYAWPQPPSTTVLQGTPPDFGGMNDMLQRIATLEGTTEVLGFLTLTPSAVSRLEALVPDLQRRARDADDIEAAWIGKGRGNIVRLACHLAVMEWAQDESTGELPIEARHVETAHRLWSTYYLPHARSVFGQAGASLSERLARKATRWLKRGRSHLVSREEIRRQAVGRRLVAAEADDVIARLEEGHVLRALGSAPTGGRTPRRWAVNPSLRSLSGLSGLSATT